MMKDCYRGTAPTKKGKIMTSSHDRLIMKPLISLLYLFYKYYLGSKPVPRSQSQGSNLKCF
jgi:hypothetical protein